MERGEVSEDGFGNIYPIKTILRGFFYDEN